VPAITADTSTLQQLPAERPEERDRPVRSITTAPAGFEGEGFPVRRGFAGLAPADLDPFVHFDQMGEVEYAPMEPKGTPWHPHRGFETVTYMIDGEMVHQDSHGGGGVIRDSATQWMTAGSGILHIETPPEALVRSGGLFHGVQLWVNLAAKDKMIPPAYQAIDGQQLTLVSSADGGSLLRIIAGNLPLGGDGSAAERMARGSPGRRTARSSWRTQRSTLVNSWWCPGTRPTTPWSTSSRVRVRSARARYPSAPVSWRCSGRAIVCACAPTPGQESRYGALEVMLLGGRPIGEAVAHSGPFVMNTRDELVTAFADYEAGRLGTVPAGALQPYRG
jgi:redox-sensitive bicupin YhaK (pirin superfamily)